MFLVYKMVAMGGVVTDELEARARDGPIRDAASEWEGGRGDEHAARGMQWAGRGCRGLNDALKRSEMSGWPGPIHSAFRFIVLRLFTTSPLTTPIPRINLPSATIPSPLSAGAADQAELHLLCTLNICKPSHEPLGRQFSTLHCSIEP